MESEGLVPIYVPRPLVRSVYELIVDHWTASGGDDAESRASSRVELNSNAATSGVTAQTQSPAGAGASSYVRFRDADETWPDELLRQAYDESPLTMKTLLDWMTDHPDERFTTAAFADALGFTGSKATWRVPGVLGGFTKRMKRRYGRDYWPFSWCKDENGLFLYWMPASMATRFRSFRDDG